MVEGGFMLLTRLKGSCAGMLLPLKGAYSLCVDTALVETAEIQLFKYLSQQMEK